jgi:hypothetical protein
MILNREIFIWKERGRGERERGVGGRVSRQSYLRLGLGEIEGKYRDRNKETEVTIKIPGSSTSI